MPLDEKYPDADNSATVDYVTLPMGAHARSQYINYNQVEHPQHQKKRQQQQQQQQLFLRETNQSHTDFQEYEHLVSGEQYTNQTSFSDPMVGASNYLPEINSRDEIPTPQTPNEHSTSTSPLPVNTSSNQQNILIPPTSFLHAKHYDELQDCHMTQSPNAPGNRFSENPGLIYGYISSTNYGLAANNIPINPNTYTSRPLIFDNNLNGSTTRLEDSLHAREFEEQDLPKHLSQLMHPHNVTISPRPLDGFLSSNSEDCQAMRWRDPNLSEVISFLSNPNNTIKANAAAYLQHLCYMDDTNKQRTRNLGGIPQLVRLLSHEVSEVHKNACGALRNLSYGRQNDENKRAIQNAGGIAALISLLRRSKESEVKELVTGVIWNMSSCEDLKRPIINEGLSVIVISIVKPHSGWDPICPGDICPSTVFRNASGVLRNISSAGEYARTKLRECEFLVECLLYVVRTAIEKNNIGNKIVENCVCVLRNLSYRCQEIDDPNYDKQPIPTTVRVSTISTVKGENFGCFGTSKKKKEGVQDDSKELPSSSTRTPIKALLHRNNLSKGYEQLWQPEVVQYYLSLLQSCSNPETLEAAAGAIQNLAACYWQPSIEVRAAVRKEKGLPILVELLRMEVDRVVCAVATALRNLAIDQRNKELIGKYAMRDLVQKLPSGNPQYDLGTSDDTIAAVLATINEVIRKNAEFSRSLLETGGVERLLNITRQKQKYTSCVLKFASQVLFTMWLHQDLRDVYKKHGWKEQDFVTKTIGARSAITNSPNNANNTLNRPMASQGRTRYEDKTIKRIIGKSENYANSGETSNSANNLNAVCQRVEDILTVAAQDYQNSCEDVVGTAYPPIKENMPNHSN